jgi:hypothetical protein
MIVAKATENVLGKLSVHFYRWPIYPTNSLFFFFAPQTINVNFAPAPSPGRLRE